ncbi:magnesium and cobalt transport protein CorA [Nocardia sp. NPDC020380]|uniref:magnesium and cobalt transport protein CorA n=1 Tax=Nocardia sp. NPDC020380 TaxID=3364309 RepID=UPI0037B4437F
MADIRSGEMVCAVYLNGRRFSDQLTYREALADVRARKDGFVWLGLLEPDEATMDDVAQAFGLHELAAEDVIHAHQRPKLERYGDTLFLVMRTVRYLEHELTSASAQIVDTGEIMIFLGPDFVIIVRHGDFGGLLRVRDELEANPSRLRLGPSAVMHAAADHVVDSYLGVIESIDKDIDEMEEAVFRPGSRIAVEAIYQLKSEVVELRGAVRPLGLALRTLVQDDTLPLRDQIRSYLRDVADHHTQVTEQIMNFNESLSALINAALAKVGVQQNTDMRKISAWAALAAVPTMIAGIYGMNFEHMPELTWHFGYPAVIAVMLVICGGLYANFHRNDWL